MAREVHQNEQTWYSGRCPRQVSLGQAAAALCVAERSSGLPRGFERRRRSRGSTTADAQESAGGSQGHGDENLVVSKARVGQRDGYDTTCLALFSMP